jgi:hypothetical protein
MACVKPVRVHHGVSEDNVNGKSFAHPASSNGKCYAVPKH